MGHMLQFWHKYYYYYYHHHHHHCHQRIAFILEKICVCLLLLYS